MKNPLDYTAWFDYDVYGLAAENKSHILTEALVTLSLKHESDCDHYKKILSAISPRVRKTDSLADIPFIPVRLFKYFDLLSVDKSAIFKVMTSSGTSGSLRSKIFLDRETATLQSKALSRIMTHVLGKKRLPMLIVDSVDVLKSRSNFSARTAGVLGFSMFGYDVTYMLDQSMVLNIQAIHDFLKRHPEGPIFIFGFTFMVWKYFAEYLSDSGLSLPLDRSILLHGGGWKKMHDISVSSDRFKSKICEVAGINRVINYYGMVEQTGSLFIECEKGYLHAPVFSDIVIRRSTDLSVANFGEIGIIEVLSMLPSSYPGHALLTEDIGVILGEDNCTCGRKGKFFQVIGRVENAEARGCSDV